MTHPNLLRRTRSCAKWRSGVLLIAVLALSTFGWSANRDVVGGHRTRLRTLLIGLAALLLLGCQPKPVKRAFFPSLDAEAEFWSAQFRAAFPHGYPPPTRVVVVGGGLGLPGNEARGGQPLSLPTIPLAPTNVMVAQLPRTDSASYLVGWTAVAGATGYHVRLVGGNAAKPVPPADYPTVIGGIYHQYPARTVDTVTVANPVDSTYAKVAVRAVDATGVGPFATSLTFYVKRYSGGPPSTTNTLIVVPGTLSPFAGSSHQFYAVRDSAGVLLVRQSATWSSSAPMVVSIDAVGHAEFLTAGTATLTAQAGGLSATALVTVAPGIPKPAAVIGVPASVLSRFGIPPTTVGSYGPWPVYNDTTAAVVAHVRVSVEVP